MSEAIGKIEMGGREFDGLVDVSLNFPVARNNTYTVGLNMFSSVNASGRSVELKISDTVGHTLDIYLNTIWDDSNKEGIINPAQLVIAYSKVVSGSPQEVFTLQIQAINLDGVSLYKRSDGAEEMSVRNWTLKGVAQNRQFI